ncbi:uracil-DNA glycosylase-like protein [Schizophyllum fasciatum]
MHAPSLRLPRGSDVAPPSPGEMSAKTGHHFGNPTNAFWRALHGSGLTAASKALHPSEDGTMPERFSLGLTNLVSRPTNSATELSMAEMRAGAASVLSKTARHRPRVVCYVGNQIADIMYEAVVKSHLVLSKSPIPARVQKRKNAPPRHGLEPYKIMHLEGNVRETLFFIMGSTSGRVANYGVCDFLSSVRFSPCRIPALLQDILCLFDTIASACLR